MLTRFFDRIKRFYKATFFSVIRNPVVISFCITIIVLIIGFVTIGNIVTPPSPGLIFSQESFIPIEGEVCPGGTLVIPVDGFSSGERAVSDIYVTIVNTDPAINYVHHELVINVSTSSSKPVPFEFRIFFEVPRNAPPGDYQYTRNIIQEARSEVVGFDSSFTIIDCN
jgi:hypothetical protein